MLKVLVVDDSATMRKIIIRGLASAGIADCEFTEASDGAEGLEALSKAECDLILSDINMPNVDGIEFVKAVRNRKESETQTIGGKVLVKKVGSSVPILMISTEGSMEKVQEALGAGATDYLKKPFTPDQLQEKIKSVLS